MDGHGASCAPRRPDPSGRRPARTDPERNGAIGAVVSKSANPDAHRQPAAPEHPAPHKGQTPLHSHGRHTAASEENWEVDDGEVIGRGGQGVVRLGRDPTGEVLAVKMVDTSNFRNIRDIELMLEEINVLCKLKHKNIIRLVDTYFSNNTFYFAMEWAAGGSLTDYLRKQPGKRLREEDARIVFNQIVGALDYCHRRRVVHRDLKPENVLMDENNVVKIADFGLAAITAPFEEGLTLMCGTPEFTAPEIVQGREYDGPSVDIWSLGVMFFELLAGYLPFKATDHKELFKLITKGVYVSPPADVSLEALSLINSMLQVKVEKRITLDEIQCHPWVLGSSSPTRPLPNMTASGTQESMKLVLPDDPMLNSALEHSSSSNSKASSHNPTETAATPHDTVEEASAQPETPTPPRAKLASASYRAMKPPGQRRVAKGSSSADTSSAAAHTCDPKGRAELATKALSREGQPGRPASEAAL
eukprot:CAMPEP_0117653568 /NCGR_PEP_ID=MMETSP0804-20121206/3264_1 /TAXON_ID=1074897 /ORGANISM="Tetraselmis astigmatica, Strain CCMP880" /LENGTH=473 /DNA_ID=CAMNT_0005459759 /DNA_START=382 /DNA_END=1803 /DNA_ORIENTATION=-